MKRAGMMMVCLSAATAVAEDLRVDPNIGNSNFTAVFDAALGERIVAMSSAVDCMATYDEKNGTVAGRCSVPLAAIRVDNEDTKTEHFHDWATNKKSDPGACRIEAEFQDVQVGRWVAGKNVPFKGEAAFTVCGKPRVDGGKEKIHGHALVLGPGEYGEAKTVRIRAGVNGFDREKYQVGPEFTDGWLARAQSLAKVVARTGTIELSLFAKPKHAPVRSK